MRAAHRLFAVLILAATAPAFAQMRMPAPGGAPAQAPAGGAEGQQGAAPAPVDPLTREFRDCIQKAQAAMQAKKADDPAAIHACLTAEVKRQEGRLSQGVARLARSISPDDKKRFDDANTAWRRFRDAHCLFIGDPKGPPPINLANADCTLNITVGRALDIERMGMFFAQQEQARAQAAQQPPAAPAGDAKK